MEKNIVALNIQKLFGEFDYEINFDPKRKYTIITAPNGYGKSTILGIINAFASGNTFFFSKLDFKEIKIVFSDETVLSIVRKRTANGTNIVYKYLDEETARKYSNNIAESEASLVAAIFPFLTRISINQWRHNQTGEIYELDQIYDKFGQHPALKRSFSVAPWFEKLRSEFKVALIGTNRLYSDTNDHNYKGFSIHSLSVTGVAKIIKKIINENLLGYFNNSRELEASFAKRLITSIGQREQISQSQVNKKISDIQEIELNYSKVGLIANNLEDIDENLNSEDQSALNVLSLYLDDMKTKLGYLDELAQMLELFKNSLNDLLEHKRVEISLENGFVIKKKNGEELALNGLSSGEQHLIVLLGRLLFDTPADSFVLIDEPEISLHPYWLKQISSIFERIQNQNRFNLVIATHSPTLIGVNWDAVVELAEQVNG